MYVYAKNKSTVFTKNELYNPYSKRRYEKITSKSPFLIAMARGVSFKVKYPMKMNRTLQYINSSIKFYLHESQFFLNKKSIELFMSFFWNIKLINNIKSFAKKSKIEQVKGEHGYAYLLKKEQEDMLRSEIEKKIIWKDKMDALDNIGKIKPKLIKDIYKFITDHYPPNADYVRPDLIPAIPKKFEFCFRKCRWVFTLSGSVEAELIGNPKRRLKSLRAVLELDNFKIAFKTYRIGKMLKAKAYRFKFNCYMDRMMAYYEPLSNTMPIYNMNRDIHEELSEIDRNELFIEKPSEPTPLKKGGIPLAYINSM